MIAMRRRMAVLLMDIGSVALPPARREWLKAMNAEAAHVADEHVLNFAAGCLLACVKERVRMMTYLPSPAHYMLVAGLLLMAALTARSGLRMTSEQLLNAKIFVGIAASYILAAVWSVLRGARGLIQAASIFLVTDMGAAFWLSFHDAGQHSALNASLISAVALEGVVIWFSVLLVCALCAKAPART